MLQLPNGGVFFWSGETIGLIASIFYYWQVFALLE